MTWSDCQQVLGTILYLSNELSEFSKRLRYAIMTAPQT